MEHRKLIASEPELQEAYDQLRNKLSHSFSLLAPAMSNLLFDCQDAKNYLSFGFADNSEPNKNFHLILRKDKADPEVICPTCHNLNLVVVRQSKLSDIREEIHKLITDDTCGAYDDAIYDVEGIIDKHLKKEE